MENHAAIAPLCRPEVAATFIIFKEGRAPWLISCEVRLRNGGTVAFRSQLTVGGIVIVVKLLADNHLITACHGV